MFPCDQVFQSGHAERSAIRPKFCCRIVDHLMDHANLALSGPNRRVVSSCYFWT